TQHSAFHRSPSGSLHVNDSRNAAKRLDDLLQVLHVADLHGHVDSSHLIVDRGFDVADVGVDPGNLRAHVRENAFPILDLDRQTYRVRSAVGSFRPLDGNPPFGVIEQVQHVGTGGRVHGHALAASNVADDLFAANRV